MLCKGKLRPANKGSIFLRNVGECLPTNIAYGPRKSESFYHNTYRYPILILSCHQHPDLPTSLFLLSLSTYVVCVLTLPGSFILITICADNGLRIHSLSNLLHCHVTSKPCSQTLSLRSVCCSPGCDAVQPTSWRTAIFTFPAMSTSNLIPATCTFQNERNGTLQPSDLTISTFCQSFHLQKK